MEEENSMIVKELEIPTGGERNSNPSQLIISHSRNTYMYAVEYRIG